MATIRSPNELHFMQSFEIDPEKQKYETVRIPEENTIDISFLGGWKSDSITLKKFFVYMDDENNFCFTILQNNDIIFNEKFPSDFETITKIYFELYSESKTIFSLEYLFFLGGRRGDNFFQ